MTFLIGRKTELPRRLSEQYPELGRARWRRGGLAVRVAGWCLGQSSVAAITLWRTVFIAPDVTLDAELALHEFRHVQQFEASLIFPLRYVWETATRGYFANRFEVDARHYASRRMFSRPPAYARSE